MEELRFEELTTRQKLGMTFTAFLNGDERTPEEDAFVLDLIKNHSLGSVWIQQSRGGVKELMEKVKEVADYPILVFTDAEGGIAPYTIGRHNAIAATGNEKHAYIFGKVLGVTARKRGYTVVCAPVLDMIAGSQRSLGTNRDTVSKLATAIAKGMHDGGILNLAKHYPSASNPSKTDSHMAEPLSPDTREDLLENGLYPYKRLMEEDLLDGVMTGHDKLVNIDPDHPASLSKPVIDVIRDEGFDGIIMTDALNMMGIRAKYGLIESKGRAIAAGNDTILPWVGNINSFKEYCEAYDKGLIPDERLDEAAKRILAAQHKTTLLPKDIELTDEEIDLFNSINKDGVYAKTEEGVLPNISRDGNHYFAVMVKCELGIEAMGKPDVDTFSGGWQNPFKVKERILELFPNSTVTFINEFPTGMQNYNIFQDSLGCDELVFLTFSEFVAFTGEERLTHRFVKLVEALQATNRVSTVVHFGNPLVLEELPHMPRWIIGSLSEDSVNACLDVLAGEYSAKGVLTCDLELK